MKYYAYIINLKCFYQLFSGRPTVLFGHGGRATPGFRLGSAETSSLRSLPSISLAHLKSIKIEVSSIKTSLCDLSVKTLCPLWLKKY